MTRGGLAKSLAMAAGVAATAFALLSATGREPAPYSVAAAELSRPTTSAAPQRRMLVAAATEASAASSGGEPSLSEASVDAGSLSEDKTRTLVMLREIGPGGTLAAVLAEAGIAASARAEVALALGAEYDLRRLRPGHQVIVEVTRDGTPRRVALKVEDGLQVEAIFGDTSTTRVVAPEPEIVTLAGEARVESSIFAALEAEGIPARFAIDLAQMLGGTVDLRRDLQGGERLRLLWREARAGGEPIRQPEIAFASLESGDGLYEVVWPADDSARATIYRDGQVLRIFAQPVDGARLSSVFGRRRHPVYGTVRMHTGVDFAAAKGTPVRATAPGRIAFIGWRRGYGRLVEIAHDAETMTRYAHLSAVPGDLAEGGRVAAGDTVGLIGATGTATGPNLHYEVLVDGRPMDPLSDDSLARVIRPAEQDGAALARLRGARAMLDERLAVDLPAYASSDRL
ncbi:M23 family metallopeptidase [Marinovum algicola]|uniref:M23 family metallopeptidase n=1 Tax=Marinovum algicola TaxID=42444 RepID=UPI003D9A701E